jgi:hypothetical protein
LLPLLKEAQNFPPGTKLPKGEQRHLDFAKGSQFTFRNQALKDLWEQEITGQTTDGMWERHRTLYWYYMPTSLGGSTKVTGEIPAGAKSNYRFTDLLRDVGDRMLDIIQKSEPAATMGDLKAYLVELEKAVKAGPKEQTSAPLPGPGEAAPASEKDQIRRELEWRFNLKNPKVVMEKLLEGQGSRANQYHFFAIFQDPATQEYIGGNAYGSFGKKPKSVEVARNADLKKVEKKLETKIRQKERKGYGASGRLASTGLRDKLVRLAHDNPKLRKHLVPILKQAAAMTYRAETLLFDTQQGDLSQRWKRAVNAFKRGNIDLARFLRTAANIIKDQAGGRAAYPGADKDIAQILPFLEERANMEDWTVLYDVSWK